MSTIIHAHTEEEVIGTEKDYTFIEKVGEGGFGEVWKAVHKESGTVVAIKKVFLEKVSNNVLRLLERECECLLRLKHNCIIEAWDVFQSEDEKVLFMVMEYCSKGDMLAYMLRKKKLSEKKSFSFISRVVEGVDFMHKEGYCHRDLKLENLFLDKKKKVKVGDFGFSTKWSNDAYLKDHPGSFHYSSPEIVTGSPYKGPEADVWSLGVILFTMATGMLPFRGDKSVLANKIVKADVPYPTTISSELKTLLLSMLNPNRRERATLTEVKSSAWFQKMEIEIVASSKRRSSRRGSVSQLISLALSPVSDKTTKESSPTKTPRDSASTPSELSPPSQPSKAKKAKTVV